MSWQDLNNYIILANTSEESSGFVARYFSDSIERKRLVSTLSTALAERIEQYAEQRIASAPGPGASVAQWQELGVTDQALFHQDLLTRCEQIQRFENTAPTEDAPVCAYNSRDTWDTATPGSLNAARLFLHALCDDPNPFRHLPPLLYLAHHPRVNMFEAAYVSARERSRYNHIRQVAIVNDAICLPVSSATELYMQHTLAMYIFLNILENIENGREVLESGMARTINSFPEGYAVARVCAPIGQPQEHTSSFRRYAIENDWFSSQQDNLHYAFWRAEDEQSCKEADPKARAVYMERCLNVVVAWYTVMKAEERKWDAIGCKPTMLRHTLTELISSAFGTLKYPFLPSKPIPPKYGSMFSSQGKIPDLINAEPSDVEPPSISPAISALSSSPFLNLPPEIHLHIQSFLLPRTMTALSSASRTLHALCMENMYADAFHGTDIVLSARFNPVTYKAHLERSWADMTQICKSLLASPALRRHVRKAYLRFSSRSEWPVDFRTPWRYDLPLTSPLAKSLSQLRSVDLRIEYEGRQDGEGSVLDDSEDTILVAVPVTDALRQLVQTSPLIRSLRLTFSRAVSLRPSDVDSPPSTRRMFEFVVDTTDEEIKALPLRTLLIKSSAHASFGGELVPAPIRPLLQLYPNLRTLELYIAPVDLEPVSTIPVCSSVRNLTLCGELAKDTVQALLERCFPNVTFLHLEAAERKYPWTMHAMQAPAPLDLESVVPRLERLTLGQGYGPAVLPSSTRQVELHCTPPRADEEDTTQVDVVSENVLSVKLRMVGNISTQLSNPQRLVAGVAARYPGVKALEMPNSAHGFNYTMPKRDLIPFVDKVQTLLPGLRILIVHVRDFMFRPQRRDFPVDDGVDNVEADMARHVFGGKSQLEMVSFTGLADESTEEERAHRRGRFWVRDGHGGVKIVGEGDLPSYVLVV